MLAMLAGCGSGGSGLDTLAGTQWQSPIVGFNCIRLLVFTDAERFGSAIVCQLQGGQTAMQQTSGTYAASGGTLTLSATESSCPGASKAPVSVEYTPGTDLTVASPEGVIDYIPAIAGPSPGGSATYGCFDGSLHFTASPLLPL